MNSERYGEDAIVGQKFHMAFHVRSYKGILVNCFVLERKSKTPKHQVNAMNQVKKDSPSFERSLLIDCLRHQTVELTSAESVLKRDGLIKERVVSAAVLSFSRCRSLGRCVRLSRRELSWMGDPYMRATSSPSVGGPTICSSWDVSSRRTN